MTIAITSSGIALDGPLVAGEKVAVSVSGLALAAEDKPTLALLARFPDALLASVELAEDAQTPGTWTGELDTATKQTALFFATARADERRDAALELVSGRASLARLTVPMANSALCPKPDGSPFASPVYIPVPGPPGTGGDPYDQAPEMDGEASPGTSDEYARGDHRHPTDTTRQAVISDLAAIRSGAEAGATAVQPAALSAYRTASAQDAIDGGKVSKSGDTMTGQLTIDAPVFGLVTDATFGVVVKKRNTDDYTTYNHGGVALIGSESGTSRFPRRNLAGDKATLAFQESLATTFSSSSTYAVGDYVTHEGLLYKCTTAVATAGAWNAANWTAVSAMAEMPAPITVDSAMSSSSTNPVQNKAVDAAIKECVPWANAAKNAVTIGANTTVATESLVVGNSNSASGVQSIAAGWNNSASGRHSFAFGQEHRAEGENSFAVGENCYARGKDSFAGGYLASTSSNNTGRWGTFVWNGGGGYTWYNTHGDGTFNVKTQGGTAGFYIGEDSLASLLRYAFASPTPSVSGTSATVACEDRAINDFTVATGITSLTITPPADVTGRARDFFCRVTLTDSSLPTVTLSGGTIDIGASEVAGMAQGVNLLMFTEISSGHWLASRRSAS